MKKKSKPTGVTMFEGAPPKLFAFAKANRHRSTPAESKLWEMLKGNQLAGYKFRRQHPVGYYILDFYCHRKKLAIEVDGEYHLTPEQQSYDAQRKDFLQVLGIKEIRFSNYQVMNDMNRVGEVILKELENL